MLGGMSHPRVRPEFARPLAAPPEEFFAALGQAVAEPASTCRGRLFEGGAILRLRTAEERLWSPALHVHVDELAAGSWQVHGRFSPSSPVWMAFIAIYLALGCIGICAACYGAVQWILGDPPWALVGVPIVLALAGFTYGAAFIGQGLGAEDMFELRTLIERVADGVAPDPH